MVEVSDGKQWRIAGVLLLDLLCGRALHVVLVCASVIEPENRMTLFSEGNDELFAKMWN